MRNATILVVRLRGTATEAIKNIVLAGIGKLVIVDSDDVAEEDLGAGFFFREEDVGKKASMQECRLPFCCGRRVLFIPIADTYANCLHRPGNDREWRLPRPG